jgi:Ornithine carbamoyltransferase
MGKKETIEDTARVLGRFYDGIEYRGYKQSVVEELAATAGVPVWNGLTDVDHPTQILADLLTIEEHIAKPLNKIKVVFCGDVRNNMAYAWMYGCAKMGMHFVAYGPQTLADEVDKDVLARANAVAKETGATIEVRTDAACLKGADVLYTDIWASMGEEDQIPERVKLLTPYKVTMDMVGDLAASGAYTGATLIGWLVCGLGTLALCLCFYQLGVKRPDLQSGIFAYARDGFGEYIGFNVA